MDSTAFVYIPPSSNQRYELEITRLSPSIHVYLDASQMTVMLCGFEDRPKVVHDENSDMRNGRAYGLAINRSRVQILLGATLHA